MTPTELAHQSISYFLKNNSILPTPENIDDFYKQKAACFVSLHTKSNNELRGCIGTLKPQHLNLAEEIIYNALSAAFDDPRFPPLEEKELGDINFSVDILSTPEQIQSPNELDPKKYGVIISFGRKNGVLLPDLEGVDTIEEQLSIAAEKGGIDLEEDEYKLERFEVKRF